MAILAIDLGGTKIAAAIFSQQGSLLWHQSFLLNGKKGGEVAKFIQTIITDLLMSPQWKQEGIEAIGIAVPGVSYRHNDTVYAPNIPGWENYPLLQDIEVVAAGIPVIIESDRSCYIMGEKWMGAAKDVDDVIYIAVGTGIGAGIISGGHLIKGYNDIGGAIGWLALNRPHSDEYKNCGFFETYASGAGMQKLAKQYINDNTLYKGFFSDQANIASADNLIAQYQIGDELAKKIVGQAIVYWGMAIANLVSIFNPQKIIFGGGVFGAAAILLPYIKAEAVQWAQPVSMAQVELCMAQTGSHTGLYGAAFLALKTINPHNLRNNVS